MKKKLVIFMALVMVFSLAGCSSSKLNANNTRTAKAIINAVDDYLNGETDATTAYDLVNTEEKNIDESDENSSDRLSFSIYTSSIAIELVSLRGNLGGDAGVIEDNRNKIAELVGESKINTGARRSSSDDSEEESEGAFDGIVRSAIDAKTTVEDLDDIPSVTMTFSDFEFEYPEGWSTRTSDDGQFLYLYPTENPTDGMVMIEYEKSESGNTVADMVVMDYNIRHADSVVDEGSSKSIVPYGWSGMELLYTQKVNDQEYATDACLIPKGDSGILYAGLVAPEDSIVDYSDGFLKIILSMNVPAT